jgi:hypothetical protein
MLDSVDIPYTHFDAVCRDERSFYATGANLQHGYIFKGNVQNNIISKLCAYQVHDFPHGIDVIDNTIAYTSYSTSGIHFMDKSVLSCERDDTIVYR